MFRHMITDKNFRTDRFPNLNPHKSGQLVFGGFMEMRRGLPWM